MKNTLCTYDNGKISHILDREGRRKFYCWLSSGCGLDHLPHLAPRLKKEYSYTCTSFWFFMVGSRDNFTINFTFSH
jgi:hypothetical protein